MVCLGGEGAISPKHGGGGGGGEREGGGKGNFPYRPFIYNSN